MVDPSVAKRLVDSIIADFPDHKAGTRPIHTIGIGVKGTFEPSEVARSYCIAEHFQPRPDPVKVTVRFSNGSGSPAQHDGWNDVRGMATRFHLEGDRATDLIAMTLGGFFVRSVEKDRSIANVVPGWKLGEVIEGDAVSPAHPAS